MGMGYDGIRWDEVSWDEVSWDEVSWDDGWIYSFGWVAMVLSLALDCSTRAEPNLAAQLRHLCHIAGSSPTAAPLTRTPMLSLPRWMPRWAPRSRPTAASTASPTASGPSCSSRRTRPPTLTLTT
eukprot:76053-Chlamydomonas_euryale.AAC.1